MLNKGHDFKKSQYHLLVKASLTANNIKIDPVIWSIFFNAPFWWRNLEIDCIEVIRMTDHKMPKLTCTLTKLKSHKVEFPVLGGFVAQTYL